MEFVALDQADQFFGVGSTGRVAGLSQPVGPALVVGRVDAKEEPVAKGLTRIAQKFTVGDVAGLGCPVPPEAAFDQLALFVVIIVFAIDRLAVPVRAALHPEVVVAVTGQFAFPGVTFQNTLGQFDAGRNAGALHFSDGDVLIAIDVVDLVLAQLRQ